MTAAAHATLDTIAADFTATVKKETGINAEFTMRDVNAFTVTVLNDSAGFRRVVDFVKTIPGVTLEDTTFYAKDDDTVFSDDEYYAFFDC